MKITIYGTFVNKEFTIIGLKFRNIQSCALLTDKTFFGIGALCHHMKRKNSEAHQEAIKKIKRYIENGIKEKTEKEREIAHFLADNTHFLSAVISLIVFRTSTWCSVALMRFSK